MFPTSNLSYFIIITVLYSFQNALHLLSHWSHRTALSGGQTRWWVNWPVWDYRSQWWTGMKERTGLLALCSFYCSIHSGPALESQTQSSWGVNRGRGYNRIFLSPGSTPISVHTNALSPTEGGKEDSTDGKVWEQRMTTWAWSFLLATALCCVHRQHTFSPALACGKCRPRIWGRKLNPEEG